MIRENCLPTLNLPKKVGRKEIVERPTSAILKRENFLAAQDSSDPPPPAPCYSSLTEFKTRVGKLKLEACWEIIESENHIEMKCNDTGHLLPKFQIFVNEDLTYKIRCYGWLLPQINPISDAYGSFKDITFSNFVLFLKEFNLCEGKFIFCSSL